LGYEIADLELEKIEYEIEFKILIEDHDLKKLEFLKQALEDDDFAAAEKISLTTQSVGNIVNKITAEQEGIDKIMADVEKQGYMT
jgi:hypothetical protein